ncbi:MAG TPA: hypothetical protein DGH14_13210, partial [Roseburia sp.]|nr:hypothetical protein [Roseburia sp.]
TFYLQAVFFHIKFVTCKILYITTVHLSYSKDNLFLDKLLAISCIFLYFRHFLPAIKTNKKDAGFYSHAPKLIWLYLP